MLHFGSVSIGPYQIKIMDDGFPFTVVESQGLQEERSFRRPELNESISDLFRKRDDEATLDFANKELSDAQKNERVLMDHRRDNGLEAENLDLQLSERFPDSVGPASPLPEFVSLAAKVCNTFTGKEDGRLTLDNTQIERTMVPKFGEPERQEQVNAFILTPKHS